MSIDSSVNMASSQTNWPYIINLGNSIIGVSVLAMPFCFKECGIVLGPILLLISSFLTHTSCQLLIKGAISSRKRSYQFLAYHTFGQVGKLAVEISIIGLLLGTCVAFYVIIGDLGSAIVSKLSGLENNANLRTSLLVTMGLFVALPLGFLRNVESLSNISAISLSFYLVFVAEVVSASLPNLWSGLWVHSVSYWNWSGVFKCLPIFSLAFSCQTQLFVMYDALPEPSLSRMDNITKSAVALCTVVYLLVGYFGYVAFCNEEVMGDILMNFRPTIFSESIKLGFALSVAVSFPLVIFPCRASIYTLCFAKFQDGGLHENVGGSTYIPPFHFKAITFAIVVFTMIIGIFIPNIEFVLAATGATMGTLICFIFPALTYLQVSGVSKNTTRGTAQTVLILGVVILFVSTYMTLKAPEGPADLGLDGVKLPEDDLPQLPQLDNPVEIKKDDGPEKEEDKVDAIDPGGDGQAPVQEKRQEPPNPQAPPDSNESRDTEKKEEVEDHDERESEIKEAAIPDDSAKDAAKLGNAVNPDAVLPADPAKAEKDVADVPVNQPELKQPNAAIDQVPVEKQKDQAEGIKETNDEAKALLVELKNQQQENLKLIEKQKEILQQLEQHKEQHQADAHNAGVADKDPAVPAAQNIPQVDPQQQANQQDAIIQHAPQPNVQAQVAMPKDVQPQDVQAKNVQPLNVQQGDAPQILLQNQPNVIKAADVPQGLKNQPLNVQQPTQKIVPDQNQALQPGVLPQVDVPKVLPQGDTLVKVVPNQQDTKIVPPNLPGKALDVQAVPQHAKQGS